ncbi:MAG TPA: cupredoxin domain-containing protein [bacterium]|nr:cupredoxin domain-containing protein [bacterium]
MNHKFFAAAALVVLLGTGCAQGVEEVSNNSNTPTDDNSATNIAVGEPNPNNEDVKTDDVVKTDDANIKTFTVTGENFSFEPSTLTVKKGDTVRIIFKNEDGFHDLKIDELNVATKQIQGGAEETVEFVADKAGTFEYYCSVGKHRDMGMKGTITVTE